MLISALPTVDHLIDNCQSKRGFVLKFGQLAHSESCHLVRWIFIMLHFLPAPLIGAIASVLMLLNILFWVPILLLVSTIKLLLPFKGVRLLIDPQLLRIAEAWIAGNSAWMRLTQALNWEISGTDTLSRQQWYLVVCNHQSWVDILVLQHVLNRRIPLLKFFLKKELIWVPIMGLAWWALEFPFMRRRTEAYLKQHPEERGRDAATTRAACEKYALIPTSVMNFLEGTRCTPAKQQRQKSPYQHLLKPKAGGVTLALEAMGEKFGAVLDITLIYPAGTPNFWQFLQGRVPKVVVQARTLPVPPLQPLQAQRSEQWLRDTCQLWVNQLWAEKDLQISKKLTKMASSPYSN